MGCILAATKGSFSCTVLLLCFMNCLFSFIISEALSLSLSIDYGYYVLTARELLRAVK